MAGKRGPRDKIRTLERKLGFFSERGLSRTPRANLSADVLRMVDEIDAIKQQYHTLTFDELSHNAAFDQGWRDVFWKCAGLWPKREDDEPPTDPECYPRSLVMLEEADRKILEDLFRQLVIEKCITYQRNQAAKPRRTKALAEAREVKQDEDSIDAASPFLNAPLYQAPPAPSPVPGAEMYSELYDEGNGYTSQAKTDSAYETTSRSPQRVPLRPLTGDLTASQMRATKRWHEGDEYADADQRPRKSFRYAEPSPEESAAEDRDESGDDDEPRSLIVRLKVSSAKLAQRFPGLLAGYSLSTMQEDIQRPDMQTDEETRPPTRPARKRRPKQRFGEAHSPSDASTGAEKVRKSSSSTPTVFEGPKIPRPPHSRLTDPSAPHSSPSFDEQTEAGQSSSRPPPSTNVGHDSADVFGSSAPVQLPARPNSRVSSDATAWTPVNGAEAFRGRQNGTHGEAASASIQPPNTATQRRVTLDTSSATTAFDGDGNAQDATKQHSKRGERVLTPPPSQPNAEIRRQSGGALGVKSLPVASSQSYPRPEQTRDRAVTEGMANAANFAAEPRLADPISNERPMISVETGITPTNGRRPQEYGVVPSTDSGVPKQHGVTWSAGPQPADILRTSNTSADATDTAAESVAVRAESIPSPAKHMTMPIGLNVAERVSLPCTPAADTADASSRTRTSSNALPESMSPPDSKFFATPTTSGAVKLILVDWRRKGDASPALSTLARYQPKLLQAVKEGMPAALAGTRLAGTTHEVVKMSATDVLNRYGQNIESSAMEECVESLIDEALDEETGGVQRSWQKVNVTVRD